MPLKRRKTGKKSRRKTKRKTKRRIRKNKRTKRRRKNKKRRRRKTQKGGTTNGGMKKSAPSKHTTSKPTTNKHTTSKPTTNIAALMGKIKLGSDLDDIVMKDAKESAMKKGGNFPVTTKNRFTVRGLTSVQRSNKDNLAVTTPSGKGRKSAGAMGAVEIMILTSEMKKEAMEKLNKADRMKTTALESQGIFTTPKQSQKVEPNKIGVGAGDDTVGILEAKFNRVSSVK